MLNEQNLDTILDHSVSDDIWDSREYEFAGTFDLARSSYKGIISKKRRSLGVNFVNDPHSRMRIALGDIVADCLQFDEVPLRPMDLHGS